jgi:type III secretion protein R
MRPCQPPAIISVFTALWMWSGTLSAATDTAAAPFFKDPFYLMFFLVGISLLPFLAIMTTSFAKTIVVLSITRQALGTPQAPPNMVIISLAMILTAFHMYPVLAEIHAGLERERFFETAPEKSLQAFSRACAAPVKNYLIKHAKISDRELFHRLANQNNPATPYLDDDFIVLAPAFLISELALAFQIGFLVYLPFVVIDLTVANLLMALGMQMLAPTTVSLPFKILLFVLVDGWRLLAEGLVKG